MKSALLIAALLAPVAALAAPQLAPDAFKARLVSAPGADAERTNPVVDQAEVPNTGFHLVKTNSGQKVLIADNGRYTVSGTFSVHDNLNNEDVSEPAALHYFANRVDPKSLPLDRMFALTTGAGTEDLYVFVDPNCPICKTMMSYLSAHPDAYRVHLMPIGILGNLSVSMAQRLACYSEKDPIGAANVALSGSYFKIASVADTCSQEPYKHNLLVARLLGLEGVPFVIYGDGHYVQGIPPEMAGQAPIIAGGAP